MYIVMLKKVEKKKMIYDAFLEIYAYLVTDKLCILRPIERLKIESKVLQSKLFKELKNYPIL